MLRQIFIVILSYLYLSNGEPERRNSASIGNKNYEICQRVFDVSNGTIIKTSDSLKKGAQYLGAVQVRTKEACERACCSTDSCNVAVLEEKATASNDGDCYLFDCGSLDDFKCIFAVHASYISMGMMVNRVDLEKTRVHEQSMHEMDLKILKTPPTVPVPPPIPILDKVDKAPRIKNQKSKSEMSWTDDQEAPDQNYVRRPPPPPPKPYVQQAENSGRNQFSSNRNDGMLYNDYGPQQQIPNDNMQRPPVQAVPQAQMENRKPEKPTQRQQQPSRLQAQMDDTQRPDSTELQRKRPPLVDETQNGRINQPKSLMNPRVEQPQRPPLAAQQENRQQNNQFSNVDVCNRYQWRCGSGECIAIYDRCTGIAQCADGSDEKNCDAPPSDDVSENRNPPPPPRQQQEAPGSWGSYYRPADGKNANAQVDNQQQRRPAVENNIQDTTSIRQQNAGRYADQLQQQQQTQFRPNVEQQSANGNGNSIQMRPVQTQNQQQQRVQQTVADVKAPQVQSVAKSSELSQQAADKGHRSDIAGVQSLDYSNGGTDSASLAAVMLGLGLALLALMLLFLSCRLRKARRRLRRGKVLDTEEGEFLVNGMYL